MGVLSAGHIGLTAGQATVASWKTDPPENNWYASHLKYFFSDNSSELEVNALYYEMPEENDGGKKYFRISYDMRHLDVCPDSEKFGPTKLINKVYTKASHNGSSWMGYRTEQQGWPDGGGLFRGGIGVMGICVHSVTYCLDC